MCAVSYEDVKEVARRIESAPNVIALDPRTLGEVLGDVRTLAEATDRRRVDLVQDAAAGSTGCGSRSAAPSPCPWPRWSRSTRSSSPALDPQMIAYAGGLDVLGMPARSERRSWEKSSPPGRR